MNETLPSDFLEKPFPITSISRADIKSLGATDEEVTQLSDEDMLSIANRMGDSYVGFGDFWLDLGSATNWRLDRKGLPELDLSGAPDEEV